MIFFFYETDVFYIFKKQLLKHFSVVGDVMHHNQVCCFLNPYYSTLQCLGHVSNMNKFTVYVMLLCQQGSCVYMMNKLVVINHIHHHHFYLQALSPLCTHHPSLLCMALSVYALRCTSTHLVHPAASSTKQASHFCLPEHWYYQKWFYCISMNYFLTAVSS